MKTFIRLLFALFVLAAFAAAGWACRTLWLENRRLIAEKTELDAARVRAVTEREVCERERQKVAEAKESLGRSLMATMTALDKAKDDLQRVQGEKAELAATLAAEREKARVAAAKAKDDVAAAAKKAAEEKRGDDDPLADVGTLKQLLDLTDKAPRAAK
ncbi:MAG: hypothetical protein ACI4RA_03980 [Kiritimatiellia bacterium]